MESISKERLDTLLLIHLTPIWGKSPSEILEVTAAGYFTGNDPDIELCIKMIAFRNITFQEYVIGQENFLSAKNIISTHIANGNANYMYNKLIDALPNIWEAILDDVANKRKNANSRPNCN